MEITDINKKLDDINKKLDTIQNQVNQSQISINAHPITFLFVLLFFFVTIEFWTKAATSLLVHIHPRHKLYFWEYMIAGILSIILLFWIGNILGINITYFVEGSR